MSTSLRGCSCRSLEPPVAVKDARLSVALFSFDAALTCLLIIWYGTVSTFRFKCHCCVISGSSEGALAHGVLDITGSLPVL